MHVAYNSPVLENIVKELQYWGIEHKFDLEKEEVVVEGFSKSGEARLVEDAEGVVTAHTRYNQRDTLYSFEDLVRLNNAWFQSYRHREPFTEPDPGWGEVLAHYKFIKKIEKVVVKYE